MRNKIKLKFEIMANTTINQRIGEMIKYFTNGNKSAFAKSVGVSNQSLGEIVGARQSAPSFAALQKIALAYPTVYLRWLLLGEYEMIQSIEDTIGQRLEEEAHEVENRVAKRLNRLKKGELSTSIIETNDAIVWQLRKEEEVARMDVAHSYESEQEAVETKRQKKLAGHTDFTNIDTALAQKLKECHKSEAVYREVVRRRIRAELARSGFNTNSLTAIYKLGNEPENGHLNDGLLATRLKVSSEAAEKLVKSGKIRATYIDGEGYRISEYSVREFLEGR